MAKRELKPKPLYGVDLVDKEKADFKVMKMDHDMNILETYEVRKPFSGDSGTCDCYAGLQSKFCRHKQIVDAFREAGKVGSSALYCYDRKFWV
jgi:hypothetical protein